MIVFENYLYWSIVNLSLMIALIENGKFLNIRSSVTVKSLRCFTRRFLMKYSFQKENFCLKSEEKLLCTEFIRYQNVFGFSKILSLNIILLNIKFQIELKKSLFCNKFSRRHSKITWMQQKIRIYDHQHDSNCLKFSKFEETSSV